MLGKIRIKPVVNLVFEQITPFSFQVCNSACSSALPTLIGRRIVISFGPVVSTPDTRRIGVGFVLGNFTIVSFIAALTSLP